MALVFQDYSRSLFPWMTVATNVEFPLRRKSLSKSERKQAVERALDSVALEGFGARYPWQLSGGMQQRTSLCRALIHEPELLMLDEPFGALDAFTREELWCVIRDLQAARNITIVLVTHDLREAVFLADRIFVMSARPGRVLAERAIDIARPRDLEVTFTPHFTGIVHELREHIVRARQ
jgi:NitT/TauT family transport system ATP-binding protein